MSLKKKHNNSSVRTIVCLRGLPGSGKSTWALELMKKEPTRFLRVNKDGLRRMLVGETWSADVEDIVHSISEDALKTVLLNGYDVIVDNTHLTQKSVNKIHKIASEIGNVIVWEKTFPVSVSECIRRNSLRDGVNKVPENVIHNMASSAGIDKRGYQNIKDKETYYEPHKFAKQPEYDENLRSAVICDLDGTLALIDNRDPYDASMCDEVDIPNKPVVETVKALYEQGYKIIFMSGRGSQYREQTIRFIEKHVRIPYDLPSDDDYEIKYELYMRAEGDSRKDSIVKRELYDSHVSGKYNVLFVMDDRDSVCALWRRELGLTCFQVAPGNF